MMNQKLLPFQAIFLGIFLMALLPASLHAERWEKLGTRTVSDRPERDVIAVTWRDGVFNALRVDVDGGAVTIFKCEVHFEKGGSQEIELRHTFRGGVGSRIVDLEGNKRMIEKVVLIYDGKTRLRKNAVVTLYGRH